MCFKSKPQVKKKFKNICDKAQQMNSTGPTSTFSGNSGTEINNFEACARDLNGRLP